LTHPAEQALANWRQAERDLERAEPGSAEEVEALRAIEHWRAEYHRLVAEQRGTEGGVIEDAESA
jgi:hypothetical protein